MGKGQGDGIGERAGERSDLGQSRCHGRGGTPDLIRLRRCLYGQRSGWTREEAEICSDREASEGSS